MVDDGFTFIYNTLILSGFFGFTLGMLVTLFYSWVVRTEKERRKRKRSLLCNNCQKLEEKVW